MPHSRFRLLVPALLLISGCTSPNPFSGLSWNKASASPSSSTLAQDNVANDPARQSSWTAQAGAPDGRTGAWSNPYANRSPAELLAESEQSRRAGNLTSARLACEQALRLAPFVIRNAGQLIFGVEIEGRFAEAERTYVSILNQKPGDVDALTSLGWSYYLQGRYDESERCLKQVLSQQPHHQVALNDLGFVYGARGNYDAAMGCFRAAGTEAQAQDAMAMLMQNGNAVQAAGEQPGPTGGRDPRFDPPAQGQGPVRTADIRKENKAADMQHATPQAKKLAEDFQRLKAESEKQQQQRRARQESQRISAPSPWNNDRSGNGNLRQRDYGTYPPPGGPDRSVPYGHGNSGMNSGGTRQFPVESGQDAARTNEAAFPGSSPSQANRPDSVAAENYGQGNYNPAGGPGFTTGATQNLPAGQGNQAIYEQSPPGNERSQMPIIRPGTSQNDPGPANPGYHQSLNSLPADNSFAPIHNTGNVTAEYRIPEWSSGPGARTQSERMNQPAAGQGPVPQQQYGAPGNNRNPWQDAQAAAAQVGLSAGPGSIGIPSGDWSAQNGQATPGGSQPQSSNRQAGSMSGINPWGQSPVGGSTSQPRQPGATQQPGPGQNAGPAQGQATQSGNGSAFPGRPLSGPTIAPAVVPSAQGRVYGQSDDTPVFGTGPRGNVQALPGR